MWERVFYKFMNGQKREGVKYFPQNKIPHFKILRHMKKSKYMAIFISLNVSWILNPLLISDTYLYVLNILFNMLSKLLLKTNFSRVIFNVRFYEFRFRLFSFLFVYSPSPCFPSETFKSKDTLTSIIYICN